MGSTINIGISISRVVARSMTICVFGWAQQIEIRCWGFFEPGFILIYLANLPIDFFDLVSYSFLLLFHLSEVLFDA